MAAVWDWLTTLLSGEPHFYIGGRQRPYMLRWYLLPRNRWLNLYLHKFCRDDDDRALHDHPWWFVSLMLWGGYWEWRWNDDPDTPLSHHAASWRWLGSIAFRRAIDRHRVTLDRDSAGQPVPCWTLVLTGPRVRTWGFWCPKGFVPWQEFVDATDEGNIGRGCGEA